MTTVQAARMAGPIYRGINIKMTPEMFEAAKRNDWAALGRQVLAVIDQPGASHGWHGGGVDARLGMYWSRSKEIARGFGGKTTARPDGRLKVVVEARYDADAEPGRSTGLGWGGVDEQEQTLAPGTKIEITGIEAHFVTQENVHRDPTYGYEKWDLKDHWIDLGVRGIQTTAAYDNTLIARGLKVYVGIDAHDEMVPALLAGAVTARDILRLLDPDVGVWWGIMGDFGDIEDFEDYAYSDGLLAQTYADLEGGDVSVVLIAKRPTRNGKPWDPEEHNPSHPLMGNSFLENGEQVELVEIRYNAGKGWRSLPATGIRVKASRTAGQYDREEQWQDSLGTGHPLNKKWSTVSRLQPFAEKVVRGEGWPCTVVLRSISMGMPADTPSRADYDYNTQIATITLNPAQFDKWTVLHELAHVSFLVGGSDEVGLYHGPRFEAELQRLLAKYGGVDISSLSSRTAKVRPLPDVWYHGASERRAKETAQTGFPADYRPTNGELGPGIYLTTSPKTGNLYGDLVTRSGRPGAVMQLKARFDHPYVSPDGAVVDNVNREFGTHLKTGKEVNTLLREKGYDSLIVHFAQETWAIVFDPSKVSYVSHTPSVDRKQFGKTAGAIDWTHGSDDHRDRGLLRGGARRGAPRGRGGHLAARSDLVLSVDQVVEIARHFGPIINRGLLESAVGQQQWFDDLVDRAAALGYSLARNHSLGDGNKRTAWVACRTLLRMGGYRFKPRADEVVSIMVKVAEGSISRDDFADWLRGRGRHTATALDPVALEHWRPTGGMFAPGMKTLDPRIFNLRTEQMLPAVRQSVLDHLDAYWTPMFGHWQDWARVYLAGSGASYWWDSDTDLDLMVGVDLDRLRAVRPANKDVADDQIIAHLNKILMDLRPSMAAMVFEPGSKPMDVTYFVNPGSYDINTIHPYAAYSLDDDMWVVHPPVLPANWGPDSIPEETWRRCEQAAREAEEVLSLPEPERTAAGIALFNWIHEGRRAAYSANGGGWLDPGNVCYQYLSLHPLHLLRRLYLCKHPDEATGADAIEKTASRVNDPEIAHARETGQKMVLYRGEGTHDRPSYYPKGSTDAGGWWTSSRQSAEQYARSTEQGQVYRIEVDPDEVDPRGGRGNFFIPDPKVRERRRLYAEGSKTTAARTIRYAHNPERAGHHGSTYGQDIEPAGRYLVDITAGGQVPPGWESGTVTFANPLDIPFGGSYGEPSNWKRVLSDRYGGKTGAALSRAVLADGHDGIITHDDYGTSEIVDLTGLGHEGGSKTAAVPGLEIEEEWDLPSLNPGERAVTARINGKLVGGLIWQASDGIINYVQVDPDMRRKGVATALLAKARSLDPNVHHDVEKNRSDLGKAWVNAVGSKTAGQYDPIEREITLDGQKFVLSFDPIRTPWWRSIRATVGTTKGSEAGYLTWGFNNTIGDVGVQKRWQRRGLATAMLEFAREIVPDLKHSHALTDDGKAWSQAVGAKTAATGGTIWRGLRLPVTDEVRELAKSYWDEAEVPERRSAKIGQIFLDMMEKHIGRHSGPGLGIHWSTRPEMADVAAETSGQRQDWPVVVEATYRPEDVVPEGDDLYGMSAVWQGNGIEAEVLIKPGARLTVTGLWLAENFAGTNIFSVDDCPKMNIRGTNYRNVLPSLQQRTAMANDFDQDGDEDAIGPLWQRWKGYSPQTQQRIINTIEDVQSGRKRPEPKVRELSGYYSVDLDGRSEPERLLFAPVGGQWDAVMFLKQHQYDEAERVLPGWERSTDFRRYFGAASQVSSPAGEVRFLLLPEDPTQAHAALLGHLDTAGDQAIQVNPEPQREAAVYPTQRRTLGPWDRNLMHSITKDHGFTMHDHVGDAPNKGFMVSLDKDSEQTVPLRDITPEKVSDYMSVHQQELKDPNNFLGGWVYKGNVFLDISRHVNDVDQAKRLAKANRQLGIYDLGSGRTVMT